MSKGISGIEIEQYFNSEEEAEAWGRDHFTSKYEYAFVDVNGKTYLLCDCGMCDDFMLRGMLEKAVQEFFKAIGLSITDDSLYIDLAADMNEVAWDLLSKYWGLDILYAFDSF